MRKLPLCAHLIVLSLGGLLACGGSQPSAEAPSEEAAKSEAPAAEGDEAPKAEEEKKEDTGMPEVTRSAKDILTAPDTTFMFSFNDSEPKEKAEEKCSAQSKDDPKKMAQCMTKERAKFSADGMQFKQDDKGKWTWLTLRRKGSTINYIHRIPFEFAEEKPNSVTLKLTGRDTGSQPMRSMPLQITIDVPNEFQIEMKDPEHGKLVYEAKIGITSEGGGKTSGDDTR